MRKYSAYAKFLAPAVLALAACDTPTEAPAGDQSVSDDFANDQPIVDDPMAGEIVVEEGPELGRTENEDTTGEDAVEAAAEGAQELRTEPSTDNESQKVE